ARMLRRRRSGIGELFFPDEHQIANVNDRVWQVGEDANGIAPKKKIQKHQETATDAPVPKRNRDDAFALTFRRPPLDQKTHRESGVPDQAEDHEIIPVQSEEAMFLAVPRRGDED